MTVPRASGGKAARRMVRNAVNREIHEAKQRTRTAERQRKDVIGQLVARVNQLNARVTELEKAARIYRP